MSKRPLILLATCACLVSTNLFASTDSQLSNNEKQLVKKLEIRSNEVIAYTGDKAKKVIKLSKYEAEKIGKAGHVNMKALEKKLNEYKLQWPVAKKETAETEPSSKN